MIDNNLVRKIIEQALREDIGVGDLTSNLTIPESLNSRASIVVKENCILSGIDLVDLIFSTIDQHLKFRNKFENGSIINKNSEIAFLEGKTKSILIGERVALNFLQRMCGVATLTHKFVHVVSGTNAKITDTRKTTPGLRMLEKSAVVDGGGVNHRFGLDDMILIKDNHIKAIGGIKNAIEKIKSSLKEKNLKIPIEIETSTIEELEEVISIGGVNRIMLDNFSIDDMRTAVLMTKGKFELEASGGINLDNVRKIAETGVDYISIGALTHSYKSIDISLEILT
ncbi:MAG: carboxylating nicotinate-nucleotide diphosphorylase [Bacteroidetes bacterium]|nr:carboxylating nicotinate-nucleotide diphosphorylase [Bacteroidota bacterium]